MSSNRAATIPYTTDAAGANAVGKLGWELAAIDAGVWVFKRPQGAEQSTPLQAIMEETVPLTEEAPLQSMTT